MYTKIITASFIIAVVLGSAAMLLADSYSLSTLPYGYLSWYALSFLSGIAASLWVCKSAGAPLVKTSRSSGSRGARPASGGLSVSKETGSVKWFSPSKGFGFITRDNGEDIFVHFRSILGKGHRVLREGQRVEFAVTQGTKGLQAEEVTTIK